MEGRALSLKDVYIILQLVYLTSTKRIHNLHKTGWITYDFSIYYLFSRYSTINVCDFFYSYVELRQ